MIDNLIPYPKMKKSRLSNDKRDFLSFSFNSLLTSPGFSIIDVGLEITAEH